MKKTIAEKDTPYGFLKIEDRDDRRYLLVNNEMESCFDLKRGQEVMFPYMRQFSYAFSVNPHISSCLLLGGGSCSYPQFYLRHYPANTIDVVEISTDVLNFSRQYFNLRELEKNERFSLYNMDAAVFLSTHHDRYDLIINDAFVGREEELRSEESVRMVHDHLNTGGMYLINLVSAVRGPFNRNLKRTEKALQTSFKDTVYLPCSDMYSPFERQNLVLAASDQQLL